jgi:2-polyprenyl-6-methoxyphenol hydroxylase-like FAD-dependent oxidoreductase
MTAVVVGAGPIGLASLVVAAKSGRVSRIIVFEEQSKMALFNQPHQIALDASSVTFLRSYEVDFDNMEGCWDGGAFYTRLGVFQEYMLSILARLDVPVDLRLSTKVRRVSFI